MTLHPRPTPAEALATAIPVLETDRFRLRGYRPGDLAAFTAFYASDRSRFVGGPLVADFACRALMAYAGHWHLRGYGRWMVEDKKTGEALGNVGLWYPEGWPEPEIGWTLFAGAEGRGVAYETALASRAYAYRSLGWSTAISLVDPANARSRALAQRLGCSRDGMFDHSRFGQMEIWRHPAPSEAAK